MRGENRHVGRGLGRQRQWHRNERGEVVEQEWEIIGGANYGTFVVLIRLTFESFYNSFPWREDIGVFTASSVSAEHISEDIGAGMEAYIPYSSNAVSSSNTC